ncbi:MAG: reverse transcriptase family protein [Pleurocapsa sp. MO_226.B13]|nr:reverse transcriptase family protein [Pleurocapsa sp. MO_226.B13]
MREEAVHFKTEFQIDGYTLFNNDRRDGRRGGGVAIYVKDSLRACENNRIKADRNTESIWLDITAHNEKIVFGVIYRPPRLDRDKSRLLYEEIGRAALNNKICVVGDFNMAHINWMDITGDQDSTEFLNTVQDNFLQQHVTQPTRGDNILDLVLSNRENLVKEVKVEDGLGNSDHNVITFLIQVKIETDKNLMTVPNFRRANFDGLREHLRMTDWEHNLGASEENNNLGVNDRYNKFTDTLLTAQKRYIPNKQYRSGKNDPRWMNDTIHTLLGRKNRAYKQMKNGDNTQTNAYNHLKREVKKEIRKAKREFEQRVAREAKNNPKGFYQLYKTKAKEKIGPLKDREGQLVNDNTIMAEMLNTGFVSVFTEENLTDVPTAPQMYTGSEQDKLQNINISRDDVIKEIDRLKAHKSPGPDEVFARVLKECKEEISDQLVNIFNMSVETGEVPEAWKLANVVPIFKKGDKAATGNYRPISLTSTVGKILESIITKKIREHLDRHDLINDTQHGFMKGKSCLTNLLSFYSEVYEAVDNDKVYDAVYLDFSKAFDRVPHERLIKKTRAHGIEGRVLNWIQAWLRGRKQRVSVNGKKSEWAEVTSGVPQGSVLGPLLFVIYINDLDTSIQSSLSKFADDTKIGSVIESEDDVNKLQRDLNKLCEWTEKWQMRFNTDKCKVLSMGKVDQPRTYNLRGEVIGNSTCERDLGVLVSQNLKNKEQCIKARNKANRALGFISRSVSNRSEKVILQLYLALVRPHLDYAAQFWSPLYRRDVNLLESVQRRMTKMIHNTRNLTYVERLKKLKLHSLERRRVRGDLIEVFKWLRGLNRGDINRILRLNQTDRTRNNGFKLDKFRFRKDLGRNWFSNRVVNEWNSLPYEVVNSASVNSFKHRVDKHMDNKGWI